MANTAAAQSRDPTSAPATPGPSIDVTGRQAWDQERPLLDAAALDDLAVGPGGPALALKFAQDYADMWAQRRRRLAESVEREDLHAALDAAISLKVTSAMVGSPQLAHLAGKLEDVLRQRELQEAAALLALIALQGQQTAEELKLRYGREPT